VSAPLIDDDGAVAASDQLALARSSERFHFVAIDQLGVEEVHQHRSARPPFASERVAHPALIRLAGDPRLGAEDATEESVISALLRVGVDIATGDANRR
jgi:hypothetical protein